MCCLVALPFVKAQELKIPETVLPLQKWEFGLRGGTGFNLTQGRKQTIGYTASDGSFQYVDVNAPDYREYYLGGYLTRNFNSRWSLRSELSMLSTRDAGSAVTVGLFPRYKLNKWLSLETGVEAQHRISGFGKNAYRAYVGAAAKVGDVEFNVRFSPNYQKPTAFSRGGWNNILQAGMSVNLSKLSNRINSKK